MTNRMERRNALLSAAIAIEQERLNRPTYGEWLFSLPEDERNAEIERVTVAYLQRGMK